VVVVENFFNYIKRLLCKHKFIQTYYKIENEDGTYPEPFENWLRKYDFIKSEYNQNNIFVNQFGARTYVKTYYCGKCCWHKLIFAIHDKMKRRALEEWIVCYKR